MIKKNCNKMNKRKENVFDLGQGNWEVRSFLQNSEHSVDSKLQLGNMNSVRLKELRSYSLYCFSLSGVFKNLLFISPISDFLVR